MLLALDRLMGVHSTLQAIVTLASRKVDFDVWAVEGLRSDARQAELWAKGRTTPGPQVTWVKHSNHQDGVAVDLAPSNGHGGIDWTDKEKFNQLAAAMFEAAEELGHKVRWGADWDRDGKARERGETDSPHFELDEKVT